VSGSADAAANVTAAANPAVTEGNSTSADKASASNAGNASDPSSPLATANNGTGVTKNFMEI